MKTMDAFDMFLGELFCPPALLVLIFFRFVLKTISVYLKLLMYGSGDFKR